MPNHHSPERQIQNVRELSESEILEITFDLYKRDGALGRSALCKALHLRPIEAGYMLRVFLSHQGHAVRYDSHLRAYVSSRRA